MALLQGLDKITARVSRFEAPVGTAGAVRHAVDPGARLREKPARGAAGERRLCPDRRDPAGRGPKARCSAAGCSRRARRCRRSNTRSTTSTCSNAKAAHAPVAAAPPPGQPPAIARKDRAIARAPRRAAGDSGRAGSRSRRTAPDAVSGTACRAGGSRRAAAAPPDAPAPPCWRRLTRLNMLSPKNARAERHAVKPADQPAVQPAFDAVRRAALEQRGVEPHDLVVDPGVRAFLGGLGAAAHDLTESGVAADLEAAAAAPRGAAGAARGTRRAG